MVTADNLNLDVLELVFSHLSGNDLPSVALVSNSFHDGVLPRLYRTLWYSIRHGKKYPKTLSPFASILRAKHLAKYVQYVAPDISFVPTIKSTGHRSRFHPQFIHDCKAALDLCHNLISFRCSEHVLPFLLLGEDIKPSLRNVRIFAAEITPDPAQSLMQMEHLETLCLDNGSWAVMDILPKWSALLGKTLTTLTISNCPELNDTVLEPAMKNLPHLLHLHVIGCQKIDHAVLFRLVVHTPLLESLSLTTFENSRQLEKNPPSLPHLRHLTIDARHSMVSSPVPSVLADILAHLQHSAPPLASFQIRIPEPQVVVGRGFIDQLIDSHALTLRKVAILGCGIKLESLTAVCESCINLETLYLCIPNFKDPLFMDAIGCSHTLHTLVDADNHTAHGAHFVLRPADVEMMMLTVPNLTKVVCDKKRWTVGCVIYGVLGYPLLYFVRDAEIPQENCTYRWIVSLHTLGQDPTGLCLQISNKQSSHFFRRG
ncbi:hypothetical protein IW262DRAFT_1270371 [Armillaria fumosa]|nr:hypothetical protein IW262DRAFT_1270371 [Armillaria fumosa]